jgi:hypothetical protein
MVGSSEPEAAPGFGTGTLVVSKDLRRHRLISFDYITRLRFHCRVMEALQREGFP